MNKIKVPEWEQQVEKLYGQQMEAGYKFTFVCIKYWKFLNY
jgi:hypothetical protein